jgi:hypothetical protein
VCVRACVVHSAMIVLSRACNRLETWLINRHRLSQACPSAPVLPELCALAFALAVSAVPLPNACVAVHSLCEDGFV